MVQLLGIEGAAAGRAGLACDAFPLAGPRYLRPVRQPTPAPPVRCRSVVAEKIKGRSGKSCRLRWWNHLNPDVKKGPFSDWEDAVILKVWEEMHWWNACSPYHCVCRLHVARL